MTKTKIEMELEPERLRGETAVFDIKAGKEVIVETGRRISARHVRKLADANVKKLEIPAEYLVGKILFHDVVDPDTGELMAEANTELTAELVEQIHEAGIKKLEVLYVNDLDRGPYVSNTLRIDPTRTQLEAQVEIYRMMRPGEPPTKEAAQNLFNNLFFEADRYDLSPARLIVKTFSRSCRCLSTFETATAQLMISITWVTAEFEVLVRWRRTYSGLVWCVLNVPFANAWEWLKAKA